MKIVYDTNFPKLLGIFVGDKNDWLCNVPSYHLHLVRPDEFYDRISAVFGYSSKAEFMSKAGTA